MRGWQKLLIAGLIILTFAVAYWGKVHLRSKQSASDTATRTGRDNGVADRIVSLAPSITEILYALGLGDQVVGVTRYCNYPSEALSKFRVGGYFDLNYEAVLELNPTLIIMLAEHVKARESFRDFGYDVLVVRHATMDQIIESIQVIGEASGCESEATDLTKSIRANIARILSSVAGKPSRRLMLAIDRSAPRSLEQVYIAGKDGFYDKMIELAGGLNVYDGQVPFPAISAEGIIQMNPEIIIELVPESRLLHSSPEELVGDWNVLSEVDAVANSRVFLLTKNYVSIPGPRFVLTLQDLVSLINSD